MNKGYTHLLQNSNLKHLKSSKRPKNTKKPNFISKFFLKTLLFCYLFGIIKADNPVRCTLHEIIGDWTIVLSTDTFEPDLYSEEITGGKGQPGIVPKISRDHKFEFQSSSNLDITLTRDNRVISSLGSGAFTVLLQEGILLNVGNLVLNAPFRYNYVGPRDDHEAGELYESVCSETMVGMSTQINYRLVSYRG